MSDTNTSIMYLKNKVKEFVTERNWNEYHNPKNLSMSIAIESSELMEIFQWKSIDESWNITDSVEFGHMKEEIADVLIYCLSLANQLDIDLATAIQDKMDKNSKRFPIPDGKID